MRYQKSHILIFRVGLSLTAFASRSAKCWQLSRRTLEVVLRFGGEFFLKWNENSGNECAARDHFGIMPGECLPGALICRGEVAGRVDPGYCIMDLEKAIRGGCPAEE